MTVNVTDQIRECIRFSLLTQTEHFDHTYTQENQAKNNLAVSIAHSALMFFVYFFKSDLPRSIGIGKCAAGRNIGLSTQDVVCDLMPCETHQKIHSGHLQAFVLERVEIRGDGNCFFSSFAFQLLNFFSSDQSRQHVIYHFTDIGLTFHMCAGNLPPVLRNMFVEEWGGDAAAQYASFLPDEVDYFKKSLGLRRKVYSAVLLAT